MTKLMDRQPSAAGEDSVGQFMKEVRSIPLLTPEEERILARRCAAGDEEALRQMVNANLQLVVSVAREYAGQGVPLLDLIQEGSIGLLTAARKFDHTLDYRFSTYATKWIRRGVLRCLASHSGLIRLPEETAQLLHRVRQTCTALRQENGELPAPEIIAESCGCSVQRLSELMLLEPEICSLDLPAGDEENTTLLALIEDAQAPQPQEELVRRELESIMEQLLGLLDSRQRRILRMHFGMEDGTCHSLESIGKTLGISKERTRQIERQAMAQLQKMGASMGLEDFLE